jgi:hypothetical protein
MDFDSLQQLKVTRKKNGNWFTKMIMEKSTMPKSNNNSSAEEQEDSGSDKGLLVGSVYHEQFIKKKKKNKSVKPILHAMYK